MTAPHPDDPAATLDALGRTVASSLAEPDGAALARQRARLLAAGPRRPSRARVAGGLALSLAAAAALALVARGARRPAPSLTATAGSAPVVAGQWVAAGAAPLEIRFSDGSRVVLSPNAHARVEALDERGATVLLERGAAEARVRHAARTAWRFAAGPYAVRVTGTEFNLGWDPSLGRFDLAMREGRVELRGPRCDGGLAVQGRDEVHADVAARTLTLGPAGPAVAVASPVPQEPIPALPAASPVPQEPIPAPPPRRVAQPARVAREEPAPVVVAPPAPADDASAALADADAERLAGRSPRARELLLDLRRRFPGTSESSRAAYHLGVLSIEAFGAPAAAARWFEIYLREAPDGPLASEALGRRAQALDAAGDREGAREAAGRYLQRDPGGAFAAFARAMLAR